MSSSQALENLCEGCISREYNCEEGTPKCEDYKAIERDISILNLLKEKKVDLNLISQYIDERYSIEEMVEDYNGTIFAKECGEVLTQEEMQLIVNWLKEKK